MSKAAFLDRDGVINRKARQGEYITRWEEMHILPGVPAAIAQLNQKNFRVIVVSNQRCVAKGLISAADLEAMHQEMCNLLASEGAIVDAVYYCPHEKRPVCTCRKPAPGMLLAAAHEHRINLAASWMIGDSEIDMAAGRSAGCKTVRLAGSADCDHEASDFSATSLLDAVGHILLLDGAAVAHSTSHTPISLL